MLNSNETIIKYELEIESVIEAKRSIDLAKVVLKDGRKMFCSKTQIPEDMLKAHWEERRLETLDGQS